MVKITNLTAREIKDSRGMPTLEVSLSLGDSEVSASVPSGESAGSREAIVLPVNEALTKCKEIVAPALIDRSFHSAKEIDTLLLTLDNASNKNKLGGNTTLAVSVAAARAFARVADVPLWQYLSTLYDFTPSLPRIYANLLEGGVHADWALPFQEHLAVPKETSPRAARKQVDMYIAALQKELTVLFSDVPMGHEGGFAPRFTSSLDQPFELLERVVGDTAEIAIDAAANQFNRGNMYMVLGESYGEQQLLEIYRDLAESFGLVSIEDPFAEDAVTGFTALTEKLGEQTLVVGDDLTTTNPQTLAKMIDVGAGNALIIKPNQIGTLKETFETTQIAHDAGWKCIASHRGRETGDSFIADVAVAIGAFGVKIGAPTQPERVAKYDRLVEIEEEMAS